MLENQSVEIQPRLYFTIKINFILESHILENQL